MIKIQEVKIGDYVIARYEGTERRGEVTGVNREDHQARVKTDVQEFWYSDEDLSPIPISDEQLQLLGFEKQVEEGGSVKYLKGPFRVWIPVSNDFTTVDIWYREDRRHLKAPLYIHQLQNHYLEMTKVELHPN